MVSVLDIQSYMYIYICMCVYVYEIGAAGLTKGVRMISFAPLCTRAFVTASRYIFQGNITFVFSFNPLLPLSCMPLQKTPHCSIHFFLSSFDPFFFSFSYRWRLYVAIFVVVAKRCSPRNDRTVILFFLFLVVACEGIYWKHLLLSYVELPRSLPAFGY